MDQPYSDGYWTSPDDLTLHYRDYAGPEDAASRAPVICMHGLTRNARDFAPLAEHIAQHRRVIVPEMRGRGLSDYAKDSATYNPLTYVGDVAALLAEQKIERFVAIGTSLGGLMTMLIAATDPSKIVGAVLNDIGPEVNPDGIERIKGYVGHGRSFPTWIHAARAIKETQEVAFPDFTLDDWIDAAKRGMVLGQNGRISFDYDMAIAEPFRIPGNAAPPDLWPAFEALGGAPVVLLRGELSDLLSDTTVQQMKTRHPDMTAVTVARVGHAPTLDEPESRAAIDALLARVP
ncbi:alpha/beta hydrolase [Altererythrobacter arenosus]|uniref:Alpha/beta hydrolase n=1 Tax=Altererythrobacter arenosus TaxID=3032592 RepID=A0ABY8FTI6_9SPHN|nr:alpha/beta hydrolase [Altererythrobacter sp. CAU 1644]WFL77560.1 alpha/beta hydrolase [Altererythrobacter sp. CAU 1644]